MQVLIMTENYFKKKGSLYVEFTFCFNKYYDGC